MHGGSVLVLVAIVAIKSGSANADTTVTATVTIFPTVVESVYPPWATELSGAPLSSYIATMLQTSSTTSSTMATSASTSSSSATSSSSSSVPSSTIPSISASSTTTYPSSEPSSGAGSGSGSSNSAASENAAGASGSDTGAFALPKGALAAIITVVVVVVVIGAISITLYILAKRRQWDVRGSLARASRRITCHFTHHPNRGINEITDAPSGGGGGPAFFTQRQAGKCPVAAETDNNRPPWQNHRRDRYGNLQGDVEKGPLALRGKAPFVAGGSRPRERSWVARLWGNSWKI